MEEQIFSQILKDKDQAFELNLRPKTLDDFIGKAKLKEKLNISIEAAKQRGEPLDHILFSGPPGLGKTTLSSIIAREMGAEFRATSGPAIDKAAQLAGVLSNLQEGDVLFIDEIHRLPSVVEEYLYSAMEDYAIDIVIDSGPSARSIKLNLPRFTLIGATTREGLLTAPFRARFGLSGKLDFYDEDEIFLIVERSAKILGVEAEEAGLEELAKRSRGTPRIGLRLLKRIRDVAQVRGNNLITPEIAKVGLEMLGVDEYGLEEMDRKILRTILQHGGESPVGLKTIAVSVGEEEDTIEDVYEPYLIQRGYLQKTPRGRKLSPSAHSILGSDTGMIGTGALF